MNISLSIDARANIVCSAQALCPWETVAFGYSPFCRLFTFDEWKGFEYSYDLQINGNNFFQSPTARALGIGYVEEVRARLENHLLSTRNTQANITLDNMNSTFPLNQTLYFDFSHISTIYGVLAAFGLVQFNQFLPTSGKWSDHQSPNLPLTLVLYRSATQSTECCLTPSAQCWSSRH